MKNNIKKIHIRSSLLINGYTYHSDEVFTKKFANGEEEIYLLNTKLQKKFKENGKLFSKKCYNVYYRDIEIIYRKGTLEINSLKDESGCSVEFLSCY
jgi:hypothetical protein